MKDKSDTPRTDALCKAIMTFSAEDQVKVLRVGCQQLERELAGLKPPTTPPHKAKKKGRR